MSINTPKRRGAALLVVIGLISLLLISTMAFSVMMSIERNAAANFRHSVQARQMLYAGLAQAIADIDIDFELNHDPFYPAWTNASYTSYGRAITKYQDVFQSIDSSYSGTNACYARVLSAAAMPYIPKSLYQAALSASPEYKPFMANGTTLGRYAYVVANVSGLLDINLASTTANRWVGTNAGEIQIDNTLPFEVFDAVSALNSRDAGSAPLRRYESIAELAQIATNGINLAKLSNFETFSYAPPDLDPNGNPKVFIGYDPFNPKSPADQLRAKHADIVNALGMCLSNTMPVINYQADVSEFAYKSLVDYVDPSPIPEGATDKERYARPASKEAPQAQWVGLIMNYARTANNDGTYTHTVTYTLQLSFAKPFLSTNPAQNYTVFVDARLDDQGTDTAWVNVLPWPTSNEKHYSEDISMGQLDRATIQLPDMTCGVTKPIADGQPSMACDISVRVQVREKLANNIVEQVPGDDYNNVNYDNSIQLPILHTFGSTYPSVDTEWHAVWSEAIDPAINWDGYPGGGQWMVSESGVHVKYDPVSLANLNATVPELSGLFIAGDDSTGSTSAYQTFMSPSVRLNYCGGTLANLLLQNSAALSWWNNTEKGSGIVNGIVPDGCTIGANQTTWDPLVMQQRHYVKGGPLTSVGELGFLTIGQWMTINLYPHGHANTYDALPPKQFHPVLDYFTVRPTTNVAHGLVSMFSRNAAVHGCIFNQMPINEWVGPADGSLARIDVGDAKNMGCWATNHLQSITNLSDIGMSFAGAVLGNSAGLPMASVGPSDPSYASYVISKNVQNNNFGELEREGIIRNSINLYTRRQQIYTIVVRADSMSFNYGSGDQNVAGMNALNNGSVLGSSLAVFQVWRDPEPDANGKHPCFVRLCKILSL